MLLRWAAAGHLQVTSCLGSASPKAIAWINHRGGSLGASGRHVGRGVVHNSRGQDGWGTGGWWQSEWQKDIGKKDRRGLGSLLYLLQGQMLTSPCTALARTLHLHASHTRSGCTLPYTLHPHATLHAPPTRSTYTLPYTLPPHAPLTRYLTRSHRTLHLHATLHAPTARYTYTLHLPAPLHALTAHYRLHALARIIGDAS